MQHIASARQHGPTIFTVLLKFPEPLRQHTRPAIENNDTSADDCVRVANARENQDNWIQISELTNGVGSTQEYSVAKYPTFKLQGVLSRRIGLGKARRTTAKHDDNRKYARFECTTAPACSRHFDVNALKSQPPIAVQLLDKLRTSPTFSLKNLPMPLHPFSIEDDGLTAYVDAP
ncbi:hypothetical protein DFP72DRAFT_1069632 [Ephemerocybe angulata]|uniref:Uncharacterized protein n=1 Tax=Ephemerocybe angulata TaxID=980116 RepID=A0A8H6HU49_9AGAR|nr:hypothetical protein DFP72DRAFT_1069632 [Tulosesus angulatus]